MATKNNPPPAAEQKPTAENTPVPGGGRWRWSIALPGWVEIDDAGNPLPPAPIPTDPNKTYGCRYHPKRVQIKQPLSDFFHSELKNPRRWALPFDARRI